MIADALSGNLEQLVTIGITSFLRPQSLDRLLASIRRYYPGLPVEVVDTEGNLSRGRNRLARRIATPLFLLCEDDFELTAATKIEPLLDVLVHDIQIAGAGGMLLEEKKGETCWAQNYEVGIGEIVAPPSRRSQLETPSGIVYQPCDLIMNFGLFRTSVFLENEWDEDLPLQEHLEWYWRVTKSGRWKMALVRGVEVLHHKDRPNADYCAHRKRNFKRVAEAKLGVKLRVLAPFSWSGSAVG